MASHWDDDFCIMTDSFAASGNTFPRPPKGHFQTCSPHSAVCAHKALTVSLVSYHRFVLVARHAIRVRADAGQVEYLPYDRYPPQEVDGDGEEPAEEDDEAEALHDHPGDGPAEEHDDDPAEEGRRPLHLVPLEEEAERPLEADDEGQPGQKKDLEAEESDVRIPHVRVLQSTT